LEFASEAGYPSPILRGFQKTSIILPGGTQSVTFTLSPDDLSYWDDGKWKRGNNLIARIGESSADIRQTIDLDYLDQDFVMSDGHSAIMSPQTIFIVSMVALFFQ
jgi:beta-glucosidase